MQKVLSTIMIFLGLSFNLAIADETKATQSQISSKISPIKNKNPIIKVAASAEDETFMERVDAIEVGVNSKQVRAKKFGEDEYEISYPAATASPKNAIGIPYGKVGEVWKIVLNPTWTPPESIHKEYAAKGKKLAKIILPDKSNPLGKVKLFIAYGKNNSTLGLHNTNEPDSIGKRVTHGCTRLGEDDAYELARIILEQNGHDADALFEKANANPKKSIHIILKDKPKIAYLKNQ